MPYLVSFERRISWSNVSKAFLRSRNTLMLILRLSMLENHASVTLGSDVKVLFIFKMRVDILKISYAPPSNLKLDHVLVFQTTSRKQ